MLLCKFLAPKDQKGVYALNNTNGCAAYRILGLTVSKCNKRTFKIARFLAARLFYAESLNCIRNQNSDDVKFWSTCKRVRSLMGHPLRTGQDIVCQI